MNVPLIFPKTIPPSEEFSRILSEQVSSKGLLSAVFWTCTPYCAIDVAAVANKLEYPLSVIQGALDLDRRIFKNWLRTDRNIYELEDESLFPCVSLLVQVGRLIPNGSKYQHAVIISSIDSVERWFNSNYMRITAFRSSVPQLNDDEVMSDRDDLVIDFSKNNSSLGFQAWARDPARKSSNLRVLFLFFERATMAFLCEILQTIPPIAQLRIHVFSINDSELSKFIVTTYCGPELPVLDRYNLIRLDDIRLTVPSFKPYDPEQKFYDGRASFIKFMQEYRKTKSSQKAQTELVSLLAVVPMLDEIGENLADLINSNTSSKVLDRCFKPEEDSANGVLVRDKQRYDLYHTTFNGQRVCIKQTEAFQMVRCPYVYLQHLRARVDSLFLITEIPIEEGIITNLASKHAKEAIHVLNYY